MNFTAADYKKKAKNAKLREKYVHRLQNQGGVSR